MVICVGEALIDFISTRKGCALGEAPGFRKAAGGAPANVAVGLAKLGVPVRFVGRVGDDPFGHYLLETLAKSGVDTSAVGLEAQARTGLAFVSLTGEGERDFAFWKHPSADMMVAPEHIRASLFDGATCTYFGSLLMASEPARSATRRVLQLAGERGALIVFDPNLRISLWPDQDEARDALAYGVSRSSVVKLNLEELAFMTGKPDPREGSVALLEMGPRLVVVTLGDRGCYFRSPSDEGFIEPFRVRVEDTTGAGDAFTAGMLAGLMRNARRAGDGPLASDFLSRVEVIRSALLWGNAAGAMCVTRRGAMTALPTLRRLQRFINSRRNARHGTGGS